MAENYKDGVLNELSKREDFSQYRDLFGSPIQQETTGSDGARAEIDLLLKKIDRKLKRYSQSDTELIGRPDYSISPRELIPISLFGDDDGLNALGGASTRRMMQDLEKIEQEKTFRINRYKRLQKTLEAPEAEGILMVYADETTTEDINGEILHVLHPDKRVKETVIELFNRCNLYDRAWSIVYNMCGFGDEFYDVIPALSADRIAKIEWIPRDRIERVEENNVLIGFRAVDTATTEASDQSVYSTYKYINTDGQEEDEAYNSKKLIHPFRILHFKIPSEKYQPYGKSVLDAIVSPIEQLNMMIKALLIARVTRAPERRIFNIDVGNLQGEPAIKYAYDAVNFLKKKKQLDQVRGASTPDMVRDSFGATEDIVIPKRAGTEGNSIDTLPAACLSLDTKIDLLDGRSLELSKIIEEYEQGKKLWVYSCDPITGNLKPAPITWAGVTRKNTQVIKITLDNGMTEILTPDHKVPVRGKGFIEAKDLLNESLFPLNKQIKQLGGGGKSKNTDRGYEQIYNNETKQWEFTHRWIKKHVSLTEFTFDSIHINDNKNVIHHVDRNKFNNSPENLLSMNWVDHRKYHSKIGKEGSATLKLKLKDKSFAESFSKKVSEGVSKAIKQKRLDPNYNEQYLIQLGERGKKGQVSLQQHYLDDPTYKQQRYTEGGRKISIAKRNNPAGYQHLLDNANPWQNQYFKTDKKIILMLEDLLKKYNFSTGKQLIEHILQNELDFLNYFYQLNKTDGKKINKFKETFNLHYLNRIVKHEGYSSWKQFKNEILNTNHRVISIEWLDEKIDTGTITVDGNHEFCDYHTFALSSGVFVKNSGLDQISDIEFLNNRIFPSTGVPKEYLYDTQFQFANTALSSKSVIFAKRVRRVQRFFLAQLYKLTAIELKLRGFSNEQIDDVTLMMNNPSNIDDKEKNEVDTALWTLISSIKGANTDGIFYPDYLIYRNYLQMDDEEIVELLKLAQLQAAGENIFKFLPEEERPEGAKDLGGTAPGEVSGNITMDGGMGEAQPGMEAENSEEGASPAVPQEVEQALGKAPENASITPDTNLKTQYTEAFDRKMALMRKFQEEQTAVLTSMAAAETERLYVRRITGRSINVSYLEESGELDGLEILTNMKNKKEETFLESEE